jgi:hypothetical protein
MRPAAVLAASVTAACAAIIAPAGLASAEESPQEVITRLQNEGYQVNVDRVGSGPINQCVVTSVRNPQTVTELVRVADGKDKNGNIDWEWIEVIKSRSISVSLNCTR